MATQERPAAALDMLAGVPANDPVQALVRLRVASLDARLNRTDHATHELEALSRDYPRNVLPLVQLGNIYRVKQRFTDAVAVYDRAVALIPRPAANDWVIFYDRGIAYERSHHWPQAQADFEHALALSPDQPFVLNYLGYAWADMNEHLDRAKEMIQRAAASRPNDPAITDSLGWVQFREGHLDQAVKTLERATELEPGDATINGHLGDAYWAIGRKIEARYQWQRALALNPEPDDAARLEAKLSPAHAGPQVSGQ
jgi:Flp pilus assembly protein TadD